jgi:hypothetical protein
MLSNCVEQYVLSAHIIYISCEPEPCAVLRTDMSLQDLTTTSCVAAKCRCQYPIHFHQNPCTCSTSHRSKQGFSVGNPGKRLFPPCVSKSDIVCGHEMLVLRLKRLVPIGHFIYVADAYSLWVVVSGDHRVGGARRLCERQSES